MKLAALRLRQRDGVSCGPAVAVVAGAMLDADYGAALEDARWFDREQNRVHLAANLIWPRTLGTTPWGMASTISGHSARHGVRYGWRLPRRRDAFADVQRAVAAHWPVAVLIGSDLPWVIPRHWVLIVAGRGETWDCYEPSSGQVLPVSTAAVRGARLGALGFPRAFAFVLPRYRLPHP
ncbi:hypothetical protein TUM20983_02080 [Mycobacterium antarcticum]|uniref:hypothetical protein n=1 Tax=unclassified Mycolicibacterium TaxID=2636767 RepID=UPI0023837212|nr:MULTISPECIES: hypothetical protein [unclassified Mycolicibacterium]GLP73098.1 hypothetical protein TUM20983_02080 [Mycolicibacterium sp. TUM20983]GLP78812.1 hypothetical protein TUM20984_02320 [Mycolicibacterium sp. TUM20984]